MLTYTNNQEVLIVGDEVADAPVLRGQGGPGRGQGLKPIYDEPMDKVTTRLPAMMKLWLDNTGNGSAVLRALLEWGIRQEDLQDDPGAATTADTSRTTYTLSPLHIELASQIGGGNYIVGVRRVVHTAMLLDFVPELP